MQRLFVVVSKSATEEQIAKQFKRFGGMEYCNLKRDKKTGQSKGYCFVNYSTAESAAAAMKALNAQDGDQDVLLVAGDRVIKSSVLEQLFDLYYSQSCDMAVLAVPGRREKRNTWR